MSPAGAVRWTLCGRSFRSMVPVVAPGMANFTTSLWVSPSAYATVSGATLIRYSGILARSFRKTFYTRPTAGRPFESKLHPPRPRHSRNQLSAARFELLQCPLQRVPLGEHHL